MTRMFIVHIGSRVDYQHWTYDSFKSLNVSDVELRGEGGIYSVETVLGMLAVI